MDQSTVDMLLELVMQARRMARESEFKLSAMEVVLKRQAPALFDQYAMELRSLEKLQIDDHLPLAIDTLRAKLLRE